MSEFTAEEWRTAAKVLQASWNQGGFPYSAQNAGDYCAYEADRLEADAEYRLALAKCIAHVWHGGGWDECGPVERQRLLEAVSTALEFLAADGRLLPEGGRDQHDDRHVDQAGPQVQDIGFYRTMEPSFATEHFDFPAPGSLNHTATDGGKWVWDESMSQWEMREYPPTAPDGTRPWRTAADVPDGVWFTSARLDDCKYRWLRCGKNSTDYADMADPKPTTLGFQVWDVSAVNDFAPFVSVGGA